MSLFKLSAVDIVKLLKEGKYSCEEVIKSFIEQINKNEKQVEAWEFFDKELALNQAKKLDEDHLRGKVHGDLHGVPVGIKDIFDTEDMPTTDGTEIHKKNLSWNDSTVVSKLKQAGAVIMGKTVTAELAYYSPGKTKNPHDVTRTPGGSSSGSAAAVACNMVPLAVGSQTNGSVIRPASFCGVVGYKPSKGYISRHLVLQVSRTLDQVGIFSNSIEDAALIGEQLFGHDKQDPGTTLNPKPKLLKASKQKPPMEPVLAYIKLPSGKTGLFAKRKIGKELDKLTGRKEKSTVKRRQKKIREVETDTIEKQIDPSSESLDNENQSSDIDQSKQGLGFIGYIFLLIIIGFSIVGVLRTFENDLLNYFPETEYIYELLDEQLEFLAESVKNIIVIVNDLISSY